MLPPASERASGILTKFMIHLLIISHQWNVCVLLCTLLTCFLLKTMIIIILPCKYIDENHKWAMGNRQWGYSNKKVSALNSNAYMYVSICKHEAHGPHRSPEKPLQINKHICWKLWVDSEGENNHLLFVIKWSVFVKHRVPFIKRCFVPSLVEIDPMVEIDQVGLEKKMKMQTVYRQKDNRQSSKTWDYISGELKRGWVWRLTNKSFPPSLTQFWHLCD